MTPETAEFMAVFDACYAVRVDFGSARFERVALPIRGGGAEQPAKTMQALDFLERIANDELKSAMQERRDSGRTRTYNQDQREEPHER